MSRCSVFAAKQVSLAAALLSVASIAACSKKSGSNNTPSLPVYSSYFAADAASLPSCVAERGGALAYTSSDKKFRSCSNGEWAEIDMAQLQGAPGAAGAAGAKGDTGASVVFEEVAAGEICTFGGMKLKAGAAEQIACNTYPSDLDILSGVQLVRELGDEGGTISLPVAAALLPDSVSAQSVSIEKLGAPGVNVCSEVSWDADASTLNCDGIFDESAQEGDLYFITLRNVRLAVQNDGSEAFPVMGKVFTLDNKAPGIAETDGSDPANGTIVTPPESVSVTFNEAVDSESLEGITLTDANDNDYCVTLSLSDDKKTVTCTGEDEALELSDGEYTVALAGVKDLAGNEIAAGASVSFTVDAVAPEIASSTPADAATVTPPESVSVTFNEAVDSESLEGITLTDANENDYCVTLSLSDDKKEITCKGAANANLELPDGEYTVALAGVKDLAGNVIAAGASVSFTVAAAN